MQDDMANEQYYADLGRSCADVCDALDRGLEVGRLDRLSRSMLETLEKLTT